MSIEILTKIGQFSQTDITLFEKCCTQKTLNKNDVLLEEGATCRSFFYIISGSCYQYQEGKITEDIIDLHLEKEWMFNHRSLVEQSPSTTAIRAFAKSELIELSLDSLHRLIGQSPAFLQFGSILNQSNNRTHLFDNAFNPAQKYQYIQKAKPMIAQVFPIKMIAAYLKIAPETLSRVRANY